MSKQASHLAVDLVDVADARLCDGEPLQFAERRRRIGQHVLTVRPHAGLRELVRSRRRCDDARHAVLRIAEQLKKAGAEVEVK